MGGIYDSMRLLRDGVQHTNPLMTPAQVRAETDRYLNDVFRPMYSESEIMEMLESGEFRRKGVPPRKPPRYTDEQRKARREFSRRVRQGIYDVMEDHSAVEDVYAYRLNEGRRDPRSDHDPGLSNEERARLEADRRIYQRGVPQLFYPSVRPERYFRENPDATQDDLEAAQESIALRNEEIALLFDENPAHWDDYFKEEIPKRREIDPSLAGRSDEEVRRDIETELARRRGEILMERMRYASDVADRMDTLSDLTLPAEQLADNFTHIAKSTGLIYELDKCFLPMLGGSVLVSPEDEQMLRGLMKRQSELSVAHDRITMCADPVYELLDPETLADYDIFALYEKYGDDVRLTERGDAFREKRVAKHTHYKRYTREGKMVLDNLDGFLRDAATSIVQSRDLDLDERFLPTVEGRGFTLGGEDGAECWCDEFDEQGNRRVNDKAGLEEFKSGRPLLFRQNGRVSVLSLKDPLSATLTWNKPEALFNYALQYETEKLCKQLKESDKWYQTRSDNFKNMREAFEALAAESKPLSEDGDGRKVTARKYKDALKLCSIYLDGKEKEGVGDGHNPLERGHIAVACALQEYLERKLEEIELVDQARNDIRKYFGMTGEEIRADMAREKKYQEKPERRADLTGWINGRRGSYEAEQLPESVKQTILAGGRSMVRAISIDPKKTSQTHLMSTDLTQEYTACFVGGMITAELIKAERAQRSALNQEGIGPVERGFTENAADREQLKQLGEAAIEEVMGQSAEALDSEELTRFVATVDPVQLARELPAAQEMKADLVNRVREPIDKPLREAEEEFAKAGFGALGQFAKERIVEPISALRGELASGKETVSKETALKLMSSCVIHGMVQIEELGGGAKIERLLREPKSTEALQLAVETSDKFFEMMADALPENTKSVPISAVSKLLEEKKPQQLAKEILTSASFEKNLKNGLELHSIKLEKGGFKLGGKAEAKAADQPVLKPQGK